MREDYKDSAGESPRWVKVSYHRQWLLNQASGLLNLFQYRAINLKGGFFDLDNKGVPFGGVNPTRGLHASARYVHCYSIGYLLGHPGSGDVIDHGMRYLWENHRDPKHGGYFWQLDDAGPIDSSKQGYGHAFVLLAASSAKMAGHPLADRLLTDISDIIQTKFWDSKEGAIAEEFQHDWSAIDAGSYRGQNSNMHLTEALMAAFEATGDEVFLTQAESIADLIIQRHAGSIGFRVAEHFDAKWAIDRDYYHSNEMFRPSGTTPGHWLEWSRLILQLWVLGGRKHSWMPDAAKALFVQAMALGWDKEKGGFFYTLDWADRPAKTNKLWWPMCEAVSAAHFLNEHLPSDNYWEHCYRLVFGTIGSRFIDAINGGWHEELTEQMAPAYAIFPGKGDIYHALQACLIPLFPATGSLTKVIVEAQGRI